MDRIRIEGGHRLEGEIQVSGSKNAALPIMAGAILCREPVTLYNVPDLHDIDGLERLLCSFGIEVWRDRQLGIVNINPTTLRWNEAPYDLVRKMRASFFVLGPLIGRCGRARVSLPGGCAIGSRPVDIHLEALTELGARIEVEHGYVNAVGHGMRGARVRLRFPSVGATENLISAAVVTPGETIVENAAREPEVADLCNFYCAMGADIEGAGTDTLAIRGVKALHGGTYRVIPDRIEAGTYMIAAAITGGRVKLRHACPAQMEATIAQLRRTGCEVHTGGDWIEVRAHGAIRPLDELVTEPYPGFPTDMQAQFMALLTIADGTSIIRETIFENRFMHANELMRMGANIRIEGNRAVIRGVERLSGSPVMASDLRASAALILAGLAAEGNTEVLRVYHLDRGYERLEVKLAALGASIERVSTALGVGDGGASGSELEPQLVV